VLHHNSSRGVETPDETPRATGRLALHHHIKKEVPTRPQVFMNIPKSSQQIAITNQMIQRVKVASYQINRLRQSQRSNVLSQQTDSQAAAIAARDP